MATHELKILPCYYDAVSSGDKTFEIRDNSDRGFQKGDLIILKEFDPDRPGGFTGLECRVYITYVTGYEQKPGWVVFGFKGVS